MLDHSPKGWGRCNWVGEALQNNCGSGGGRVNGRAVGGCGAGGGVIEKRS